MEEEQFEEFSFDHQLYEHALQIINNNPKTMPQKLEYSVAKIGFQRGISKLEEKYFRYGAYFKLIGEKINLEEFMKLNSFNIFQLCVRQNADKFSQIIFNLSVIYRYIYYIYI